MKKVLSKVLAVIIAAILVVSAMPVAFAADEVASGTAGEGVNWVLDAEGTLTISGEGEIVVDWYAPPWENYNNDIITIDIQEGITTIPDTAFCYAENLVSVNVPASVTNMGENATNPFWACFTLREINVHEDNAVYTSIDGVVYNNDQTVLCFYPPNKVGSTYNIPSTVTTLSDCSFNYTQNIISLTLPDSITNINNYAFQESTFKSITLNNNITVIPNGCFSDSALESIVIPDSVQTIEYAAFWSSNLKNITIGSGVKTIAEDVFQSCDELTTIHYTGTETQWNEITIAEENEYLNNMAIHYVTDEMYQDGYDADCENDGHTGGIYCQDCEIFVTGVTIFATGHIFDNGICTVCRSECEHIHTDFDGICDTCGQDAPIPTINVGETKNVYIKEEDGTNVIMFNATQNGLYTLTSDMGGNDIDPYVTLFDSDGNKIGRNDDGNNGLNFELKFNAVAGQHYYFELSSYDDDSSYSITLDKYYNFSHQPTAEEPFVKFTWDNAIFQWYTVTEQKSLISTENAETVSYDWGTSSYNSENGWSGVIYDPENINNGYDFFTVPLNAGESVTVELFGDYSDVIGLWDYDQRDGSYCDITDVSTYTLTAENDGNYTLYTYSESGSVTVKASTIKYAFHKINGQTSTTLKNPVIGSYYVCEATIDGQTVMSDIFEYTYFITHQPTAVNPYIELNEEAKDAKYQWFKVENFLGEITDQDAEPFTMHDGAPAYYDQNGWTGNYTSEGTSADFFNLWLENGETLTVETTGNVSSVTLYTPEYGINQTEYPDENGVVTFTVPMSIGYTLSAECDTSAKIRAYKVKEISTAVEGQTTDTLTDATIGTKYFCEISIGDKVLTSDDFTHIYAITHQPTVLEPFVEYNDNTGATYQWYSVVGEQKEITDQDNVIAETEEIGVLASYDAENGWTGMHASPETIIYFATEFSAGNKITIAANDNALAVAILDIFSATEDEPIVVEAEFDEKGIATLTVPADSVYIIMVNSTTDTSIKVHSSNYIYTPIENETEATLKTTDKGLFACEVTFTDGSTEMSEILNTNYQIGDVNGDGSINARDCALLMQHINNWNVEIIEPASDVNGDGQTNSRDYALLMQYINGWDVTLG